MPSIVNGLFSGRSGIASHGIAIAVVGDNISNASTIGYKTSRAEFSDLIAGGQTAGKVVGSGSQVASISTIFEQGTSEFTGRPLDLAVDGNGLFVVADGAQRFYTRAGNFKLDEEGNIVNQSGLNLLGFPSNGSGALETLNINQVSQDSVSTSNVIIAGNVDASATPVTTTLAIDALGVSVAGDGTASTVTYGELAAVSDFSTVVDVLDSLGAKHTATFYFFPLGSNQYEVRGYVNSQDVDAAGGTAGLPRQIPATGGAAGTFQMNFNGDGTRSNAPAAGTYDLVGAIPWNNGSNPKDINFDFSEFTQYSSASNINAITQDGKGVGTVTSLSVEKNGDIFAILSNGQTSVIGRVGLVNFSNPEGLVRIGSQLLQQSPTSGEPIVGSPNSGTFGAISSGSVELSTVDIANEFVKLITLQRGFQANSRIITTINQLLQEIIQLA